jgi:hypothetical protein
MKTIKFKHSNGQNYILPFQKFDKVLSSGRILVKSIWGSKLQKVTFDKPVAEVIADIASWKDNGSDTLLVQHTVVGNIAIAQQIHPVGLIDLKVYAKGDFVISLPEGMNYVSHSFEDIAYSGIGVQMNKVFEGTLEKNNNDLVVTIEPTEQWNTGSWYFNNGRRQVANIRVSINAPGWYEIEGVAGGYILVEP